MYTQIHPTHELVGTVFRTTTTCDSTGVTKTRPVLVVDVDGHDVVCVELSSSSDAWRYMNTNHFIPYEVCDVLDRDSFFCVNTRLVYVPISQVHRIHTDSVHIDFVRMCVEVLNTWLSEGDRHFFGPTKKIQKKNQFHAGRRYFFSGKRQSSFTTREIVSRYYPHISL